jgi:glycerol-3-phosphate acyltransferase PlsY
MLLRLSSVGSLLGIWSFPVFAVLLGGMPSSYLYLATAVAVLVTMRHRQNIGRLLRGEEKKA